MEVPLILRIMSASVRISNKAGSIIRTVMASGNLGIIDKGVNDLQTYADRKAQACIVNSLQTKFPGICVIGEETLSDEFMNKKEDIELSDEEFVLQQTCPLSLTGVNLTDVVVWVDPLDGTSEFTQGLVEHVTVLIGLAVRGRAVAGVIHQPFSPADHSQGRSIWGMEGLGVFNLDRARFSEAHSSIPDLVGTCNIIATTRGHGTELVQRALQACKPTEILRVGGCGHKVLLLLEGRCHAYVFASPGCKKWDTCAPEAVLREAGGLLTDMAGTGLTYERDVLHSNQMGVLATADAEWHSRIYLPVIPQDVKDSLRQA